MFKKGPAITIEIGILLIIVGIASRVLTGTSSITALIPAFFGVPIAVLGWAALAPKRTRWSLIVAGVLALLGIFGTFSVLGNLASPLQGDSLNAAAMARGAMFVLCAIQLIISLIAVITGPPTNQQATSARG